MNTLHYCSTMLVESKVSVFSPQKNEYRPIKTYCNMQGRKFIEARNGSKFAIDFKNNDSYPKLIIISVDGINVVDGKEASLESKQGYVIGGYSSLKIKGWRISDSEIRLFEFTDSLKESYSEKILKTTRNCGVIGLAYFNQKVEQNLYTHDWVDDYFGSKPTPIYAHCGDMVGSTGGHSYSCDTTLTSFNTGTKMSKEKVEDKITQNIFYKFEDKPYFVDAIYYASYKNLVTMGIITESKNEEPKPFIEYTGYCPVV